MSPKANESIGILKSIWVKDVSGRWGVHDIKDIDLKPRKGFNGDFFKIEDEVQLLTSRPGPVFKDIFSTFGTTEFLVRQSIVPIVAWNEGDKNLRCIGTGFFVSASGLLITAAHVMRDPIDEKYTDVTEVGENTYRFDESLKFGVMLPANPAMKGAPFGIQNLEIQNAKWFIHPFEWAFHWGNEVESPLLHEEAKFMLDNDIAICKVRDNEMLGGSYQPLNIGLHRLAVGDRAVAIGYAEMKDINPDIEPDYQPELHVSVGHVTNIYPDNSKSKQSFTPGPCFDFDARIPGRMSGSPILVGSGILTKGVVSSSGQGEMHATGSLIAAVMHLKLQNNMSLIDLMKNGSEGIADIQGIGI